MLHPLSIWCLAAIVGLGFGALIINRHDLLSPAATLVVLVVGATVFGGLGIWLDLRWLKKRRG